MRPRFQPVAKFNSINYGLHKIEGRNHVFLVLVLLLISVINESLSNISLTFPPARKYALDFLESTSGLGACGMPQGLGGVVTNIRSGVPFNVTWRQASPNKGGIRLELLDSKERPIMDLTPTINGSKFITEGKLTQQYEIKIPGDIVCQKCVLRLERRRNADNSKVFTTCADVNIVKGNEYKEDCSNHGAYSDGQCECERRYFGQRCQYEDECWKDSDCGSHGKCFKTGSTSSYPKHVCYCAGGWFGDGCALESELRRPMEDLADYSSVELGDKLRMYWQIMLDRGEIEVVLVARGSSYVGLGWRPEDIDPTCKDFPSLQGKFTSKGRDTETTKDMPLDNNINVIRSGKHMEGETSTQEMSDVTTQHTPSFNASETTTLPTTDHRTTDNITTLSPAITILITRPSTERPSSNTEKSLETSASANKETRTVGKSRSTPRSPYGIPVFTDLPQSTSGAIREYQYTSQKDDLATVSISVSESSAAGSIGPFSGRTTPQITAEDAHHSFHDNHATDYADTTAMTGQEEGVVNNNEEAEYTEYFHDDPMMESDQHVEKSIADHISTNLPDDKGSTWQNWLDSSEQLTSMELHVAASSDVTHQVTLPSQTSRRRQAVTTTARIPESFTEGTSFRGTFEDEWSHLTEQPFGHFIEEAGSEAGSFPDDRLGDFEPADSEWDVAYAGHGRSKRATYRTDSEPQELTPMDCIDMVIGMAKGNYSRISDYYSRGIATPQMDAFWGGTNSLSAALGYEVNGTTVIAFRRKINATEQSDHSFLFGPMFVTWALGQESKSPFIDSSGDDTSRKTFIQNDLLQYHGSASSQRGVATVNFNDDLELQRNEVEFQCQGSWEYPRDCCGDECTYRAAWEYLPDGDNIAFNVFTKLANKWTGIGFSNDKRMTNTDAILGWVEENGRLFVMDTWISGYLPPTLDPSQDLYNMSGARVDSTTTLTFTRPRISTDENDLNFTNSSCLYMMFPHLGGTFNAINKKIKQHEEIPYVSVRRICVGPCSASTNKSPWSRYDVSIRLPNDKSSEPGLAERVKCQMKKLLRQVPGFRRLIVTEILSNGSEPGVRANMAILLDKRGGRNGKALSITEDVQLTSLLNSSVLSGRIGNLVLDRNSLYILPPATDVLDNNDSYRAGIFSDQTVIIVIAAAGSLLVFLIVVQILCKATRGANNTEAPRSSKEQLISNSAWKDYSPSNLYGYDNYGLTEDDLISKPSKHSGTTASINGTSSKRPNGYNFTNSTYSLRRTDSGETSLHPNGASSQHYSLRSESLPLPRSHGAASGTVTLYATHHPSSRQSSSSTLQSQMELQPDFYFMPSQRRYSGEMVRVHVDGNPQ